MNLYFDKLNKSHLIIAYAHLSTFFNRLNFTAIAMKIAKDILFDIFSKEWKDLSKEERLNNNNYLTFSEFLISKGITKYIFIFKPSCFLVLLPEGQHLFIYKD